MDCFNDMNWKRVRSSTWPKVVLVPNSCQGYWVLGCRTSDPSNTEFVTYIPILSTKSDLGLGLEEQ